jgi:hypothetical protein
MYPPSGQSMDTPETKVFLEWSSAVQEVLPHVDIDTLSDALQAEVDNILQRVSWKSRAGSLKWLLEKTVVSLFVLGKLEDACALAHVMLPDSNCAPWFCLGIHGEEDYRSFGKMAEKESRKGISDSLLIERLKAFLQVPPCPHCNKRPGPGRSS